MKLLNIGCGDTRPGPPWINIDNWEGGGGCLNEPNFIFHDCRNPLPFEDNSFDGAFASHLFEHLDAQAAKKLMEEVNRILIPGGLLCVGVPNGSYHRKVWPEDTRDQSPRLFGEEIPPGDPVTNNLRRACFFHEHKQVFTEDSLWCHFVVSGFPSQHVKLFNPLEWQPDERRGNFATICNRIPFTLFMEGVKAMPGEDYKRP